MGIKDVFDRIKGKSDDKGKKAKANEALSRRQTDEETVQVNVSRAPLAPSDPSRESPTVVARPDPQPVPPARPQPPPPSPPVATNPSDGELDPTVVAGASPPPTVRPAGPTPRAPVAPAPSVRPSVTPVAPTPNRVPPPASPVSSAADTVYQKPGEDLGLDFAAVLVGIFGEVKGEIFRVPVGTSRLGRADQCEVQLLDAKVSREHARFQCENGAIELTPLSDRNPILVNDAPVTGPQTLADGDKLQFGNPGASILRLRTIEGMSD